MHAVMTVRFEVNEVTSPVAAREAYRNRTA